LLVKRPPIYDFGKQEAKNLQNDPDGIP